MAFWAITIAQFGNIPTFQRNISSTFKIEEYVKYE
jgi:hypothetical protein